MQDYNKRLRIVLVETALMSTLFFAVNGIAQDVSDTARIVFQSDRMEKNKDIFVMDADGQNVERLTDDDKLDLTPAWSPDGTQIVIASDRDFDSKWEDIWIAQLFEHLYIINSDGDGEIQIITAGFREMTPSWSPDGKWIAFVHGNVVDNWNFDVVVARVPESKDAAPYGFFVEWDDENDEPIGVGGFLDQQNTFRLTTHSGQDETPKWSPDGNQIVWSSNRTGNYDIFVMDANGANKTNLTNDPKDDKNPVWQPMLGENIVFSSDRDGDSEIYVMDADGGNVTKLTDNVFVWDGHPTWSPDGEKIAFSTNRDRNNEIYVMGADGSNPTNLTNDPGSDQKPDWFDPTFVVPVSPKAKRPVTWAEIKQLGRTGTKNR